MGERGRESLFFRQGTDLVAVLLGRGTLGLSSWGQD